MIIIDVDLNTFKSLRVGDSSRYFYIDKMETLEIYSAVGGMLMRYIYTKRNDENDTLFFEQNGINDAILVEKISHVNENQWRDMFIEIRRLLFDINEKTEVRQNDDT